MAVVKKLKKRILVIKARPFSVKGVLKSIRSELESQDFIFSEIKQEVKDTQYGREIFVEMSGSDEMDEFASASLTVLLTFSNVENVKIDGKNTERGDILILFIPIVKLDYKDNWATNSFLSFLFDLYIGYFKDDDFKAKYLKPTQKRVDAIYDALKKKLEYYQ